MMKKLQLLFLSALFCVNAIVAQQNANNIQLDLKKTQQRKNIRIPDIEGYQTLKGDFHIHTIFSDGYVWPTVRIQECWNEGLDVMAITDHIEYRPYKDYLIKGHNHSYDMLVNDAKAHNILLIKAAEITRGMPPGHLNALFINDTDELQQKKVDKAFEKVKEQDGLMIWNHPGWRAQQPDTCLIYEAHKELLDKGLIQGMEVMNYNEWYPIVLQWCIDYNLAVFANSDIHDAITNVYEVEHAHRPMTLLFVKERSEQGIREAIESARTLAWFDQQLAGPEDLIQQLFEASITLKPSFHSDDEFKYMELVNSSDMQFSFINESKDKGAPESFTLQAGKTIIIQLKKDIESFKVTIDNCHTGMFKILQTDLLR